MNSIRSVRFLPVLCLVFCFPTVSFSAGTVQISDNGKTATLTLPLKATISVDTIMRDKVTVIPLSSLYEQVNWDNSARRFIDYQFLVRVMKDTPSLLLYEIINDAYTCSYNNPDRVSASGLPADISVMNSGYQYSLSWAGRARTSLGSNRSTTVNAPDSWLPVQGGSGYFIDLNLNITFPDVSIYPRLMSQGGICRGSVTMLISKKL
ncbi:hypothetical protein VQZ12_004711 [Salmonella enterica]|nr:hypothetical protein [Salmonella enterica subsp. salamae]EKC2495464.1 hypothetical protein [Salmonella enterica]EMD3918244.1 hypothetical protein [Salmonella enterica]